jgi:hypothetical protein
MMELRCSLPGTAHGMGGMYEALCGSEPAVTALS